LLWPRQGAGIYWSTEIHAAERIGAFVTIDHGWRYVQRCQCQAFDWVEPLFNRRRAMGKDKRGLPIKYGTNSLYGKLVQRVGKSLWRNPIWGGLITASVRAQLMDAGAAAPHDVLMFATDAVFSKSPLPVEIGDGLGQWEVTQHEKLFIVQPGLYWGAKRPKTRGLPLKEMEKHTGKFEHVWDKWLAGGSYQGEKPPTVPVPIRLFIGMKLAHARAKASTKDAKKRAKHFNSRGSWVDTSRDVRFDWRGKRAGGDFLRVGEAIYTRPHPGGPDYVSVPHQDADDSWNVLNLTREELEAQPDYVDLSAPYKD
jgi:hypothetical protein